METDTDAMKLKNYLDALSQVEHAGIPTEYQVVSGYNDVLRTLHYAETVGIYSTQTALNPPINTSTKDASMLVLEQDMPLSEKDLIGWLSDNGYEAKKTTESNTYLRQGDTVSIYTTRGLVQISFFKGKIEAIYLDAQFIQNYTLISLL